MKPGAFKRYGSTAFNGLYSPTRAGPRPRRRRRRRPTSGRSARRTAGAGGCATRPTARAGWGRGCRAVGRNTLVSHRRVSEIASRLIADGKSPVHTHTHTHTHTPHTHTHSASIGSGTRQNRRRNTSKSLCFVTLSSSATHHVRHHARDAPALQVAVEALQQDPSRCLQQALHTLWSSYSVMDFSTFDELGAARSRGFRRVVARRGSGRLRPRVAHHSPRASRPNDRQGVNGSALHKNRSTHKEVDGLPQK